MLLSSVRTAVGFWDTADLQTVAWIAGIPYPTGYPGYVMLAWLWTHALPIASPALRVNALSAVAIACGAATISATALLFEVMPLLAVLGGWTFAFAHVVWLRGTYADVHPVGFAAVLVVFALAIAWTLRGDARALAGAIVAAGVAVALDDTTVLVLAGAVIVALGRRPPPWRAAAGAALAAVAIVVVAYAYLPLRSAYVTSHALDPTLALGLPAGRPFWDDHHPASAAGFWSLVEGGEWGPHETLPRMFSPEGIQAAVGRFGGELNADDPQGMLVAAVIGIGLIWARAPLIVVGLAIGAVLPALFGASYPAEADPERYIFAVYAFAALGIAIAGDRIVRAFSRAPATAYAVVAGLLTLAVLHDVARASDLYAVRSDDSAAVLGARVAAATRDDAIVVAPWDWATALAYRAYVEQRFGRRIVVCALVRDYIERYDGWARGRQLAVLSEGIPFVPGFRPKLLSDGSPQVYELDPP